MPPGSKRLRREPNLLSVQTTRDAVLQAFPETGATGLEPATSGVTGRSSKTTVGDERLQTGSFAGIFGAEVHSPPLG
jgi:hypothetical protein